VNNSDFAKDVKTGLFLPTGRDYLLHSILDELVQIKQILRAQMESRFLSYAHLRGENEESK